MPNELNTTRVEELMRWCDELDMLIEAFEATNTMTISVEEGVAVEVSGSICAPIIKILTQRRAQIRTILGNVDKQLDDASK